MSSEDGGVRKVSGRLGFFAALLALFFTAFLGAFFAAFFAAGRFRPFGAGFARRLAVFPRRFAMAKILSNP